MTMPPPIDIRLRHTNCRGKCHLLHTILPKPLIKSHTNWCNRELISNQDQYDYYSRFLIPNGINTALQVIEPGYQSKREQETMSKLQEARLRAGLSQAQLGELAGTSQVQVARLEKGIRKMTIDWAVKLAPHVGLSPADLLTDAADNKIPPPYGEASPRPFSQYTVKPTRAANPLAQLFERRETTGDQGPGRDYIPVIAACRGGQQQEMFLEDGPIDWVVRPAYLATARSPYAMYVVGESMMPRFRPAQIVHVNPHKPPASGNGVVIVLKNKSVMVKEFIRYSSEGITLCEYQPTMREFFVSADDVDTVHTIVGLQEP